MTGHDIGDTVTWSEQSTETLKIVLRIFTTNAVNERQPAFPKASLPFAASLRDLDDS